MDNEAVNLSQSPPTDPFLEISDSESSSLYSEPCLDFPEMERLDEVVSSDEKSEYQPPSSQKDEVHGAAMSALAQQADIIQSASKTVESIRFRELEHIAQICMTRESFGQEDSDRHLADIELHGPNLGEDTDPLMESLAMENSNPTALDRYHSGILFKYGVAGQDIPTRDQV